jgi:predicted dehydrogenase
VAVCDPNVVAARQLGESLGVAAFGSLEELLGNSDAEAVYVTSPNQTHRAIALACAAAGRHVFCEKAMATTVDECYDMIEAADRHGVKLTVGHKRRLRPPYATMGDIIRGGELGAPIAANVTGFHWWRWEGWWTHGAMTGGLLHSAGVHDIDDLRFFFGDVGTVYAASGPKFDRNTDYDDVIAVTLGFRSGAIGTLQVTCRFPLLTFRSAFEYQILCERGGIRYDPVSLTLHYQRVGGDPQRIQFADPGHDHAFRLELTSFARWIREGTPPVVTAEGGLRCVEVMQAAYLSARRGQPVSLPLPRGQA